MGTSVILQAVKAAKLLQNPWSAVGTHCNHPKEAASAIAPETDS